MRSSHEWMHGRHVGHGMAMVDGSRAPLAVLLGMLCRGTWASTSGPWKRVCCAPLASCTTMTSHLKPLAPPLPPPPPPPPPPLLLPPPPPPPPPPVSASATASVSGAPASGAAASVAALASSASARFVRFGAEGRGASAEGWREKAASKAALDLRARIAPEPSASESATSSTPACAGGGGAEAGGAGSEAGGEGSSLFTATRGSAAIGSSAGPTSPSFRGGGGLSAALLRTLDARRVRPGRICTLQIPAWFQRSGHLRRAGGCLRELEGGGRVERRAVGRRGAWCRAGRVPAARGFTH